MLVASHLTTSRHGLYYFRFPIPSQFHPQRQRSSLRLSLGTRCPKEALHLSRLLCYIGEHLIQEAKARNMNYKQICDFLAYYFKEKLLAVHKHIEEKGRFTEANKDAFGRMREFTEDAIKRKNYYFQGTDEQIDGLIENYELPIQKQTPQYDMLRTEFLTAQLQYIADALELGTGSTKYDLTSEAVVATPMLPAVKPAKKRVTIAEAYSRHAKRPFCKP